MLAIIGGTFLSAATPTPLRIALIAPDATTAAQMAPLRSALAKSPGISATDAALREADVAVIFRGPGAGNAGPTAELRNFLRGGKGLVLLGAAAEAWPTDFKLEADLLGASSKGLFAKGTPMTIVNLFPHPIFTETEGYETDQSIPLFEKLSDDAQMIMEGTVGEATAPLAWVRRLAGSRLCHLVPGDANAFSDPLYLRMVGNAILWTASRPIPGARPAVQRTLMPDSFPGAFAITLPNGPSVCLDPVRGGINYIWDGDFVDLRPRWITKQGEPARIFGEIFYREKEWQPLRAGRPGGATELQFRGYILRDGYPEFQYEVGGRQISERITPGRDGSGIQRRFRVGPGSTPLWISLEPQTTAEVAVTGLERDGSLATFSAPTGGEFTIEIRRKAVSGP